MPALNKNKTKKKKQNNTTPKHQYKQNMKQAQQGADIFLALKKINIS